MSITKFQDLVIAAQAFPQKAVMAVAAAHDEHTLEAVVRAYKSRIITPVLIGNEEKIRQILEKLDEAPDSYEIINQTTDEGCVAGAVELAGTGRAQVVMKGLLQTRDMMRAVLKRENNLRTGDLISHIAMFEVPGYHKLLAVSDVAVNTAPDIKGKEGILMNSVRFLHSMGIPVPKVAVISSGEEINAKVVSSTEAAALKEKNLSGEISGCIVEGPIALDLAVNKDAAEIKGYESPVAGDADLLLVPDIVSGNVLGKCLLEFGGATTAAVVLGAKVPIILTSRAAGMQDKFDSIALAAYSTHGGELR